MISQIATTLEQSKELIEDGLNPNSADMYYTSDGQLMIGRWEEARSKDSTVTPAWSAAALWDILPELYYYPQEMCGSEVYHLTLEKGNTIRMDELGYEHATTSGGYFYDTDMSSGENLVECLANLVSGALHSRKRKWASFKIYDQPL